MSRRAGLDPQRVITAAAELTDAEGVDALTLANLARRLNVRIPSLYNHVAGLEGLHRELAILTLRELASALGQATIGKAGDDAVFALTHAYRAYVRAHPGLYALLERIPAGSDEKLRQAEALPVEVALAVMSGYGLTGDDAIHAVRAVRSAVHGFVTIEMTGGFGLALSTDESFRRLIALLTRGLRDYSHAAQRARV